MTRAPLVAVLATLLAGCTTMPLGAPQGEGRGLAFERLEDCDSRQGTELHRIVNTQAEWEQLWRQACGDGSVVGVAAEQPQQPPVVDFARSSVVVSFWGEKPNGGYGVRIQNVTEFSDRTVVDVDRVRAGPGCASIQVITYPHDIVVSAKTTKTAQFQFRDQVQDCP